MNALSGNHPFSKIPPAQQKLFLDVGMKALQALDNHTRKEAG
jgi:hypothetical protein